MSTEKCKVCKSNFEKFQELSLHEIKHNNDNMFSIFNCINLGIDPFLTKLSMMSKEEIIQARNPYNDSIITSILISHIPTRQKEILIAIVNARTN